MENVGIFFCYLVNFTAIWYILLSFGFEVIPSFGILYKEKSGNPGTDVMILKIFSPKNLAKKMAFFTQIKLNYAKF
jgi:hypothetical protein